MPLIYAYFDHFIALQISIQFSWRIIDSGSWIRGQGKPVAEDPEWGLDRDAFEEIRDSIETFIQEAKSKTKSASSSQKNGEVVLGSRSSGY